jgi:hypothetical protein
MIITYPSPSTISTHTTSADGHQGGLLDGESPHGFTLQLDDDGNTALNDIESWLADRFLDEARGWPLDATGARA